MRKIQADDDNDDGYRHGFETTGYRDEGMSFGKRREE